MRAWCLILLSICTAAHSQSLQFTPEFESARNHVAIKLLNDDSTWFDVLRYNKAAHDLTVERRDKLSGNILWFAPLKLDSVNANWFNYEDLDYLFFAYERNLYFVFEKALNNKKTIYLKSIDSTGKCSGFKELGFLEKDAQVSAYDFVIKQKQGVLFLAGEQYYTNNTAKKVVFLYDLKASKIIWVKKLPLENNLSGFSSNFEWNAQHDLYYISGSPRCSGYRRQYINHNQTTRPIFSYDSLMVNKLSHPLNQVSKVAVYVKDSLRLKSIVLGVDTEEVMVTLHYAEEKEATSGKQFFVAQKWDADLRTNLLQRKTEWDPTLVQQLTFFDGGDYNGAHEKDYTLLDHFEDTDYRYALAQRKEDNYDKELLFWRTNLKDGLTSGATVIPRKVYYLPNRVKFRHPGSVIPLVYNQHFYCFVLENRANKKFGAGQFNYHGFIQQNYLEGGCLVAYQMNAEGQPNKMVLFRNGEYNYVPLPYESNQQDVVFYFSKGRKEKFAILKLNPSP